MYLLIKTNLTFHSILPSKSIQISPEGMFYNAFFTCLTRRLTFSKIFAKNVIQILIHSFINIIPREENKNQKICFLMHWRSWIFSCSLPTTIWGKSLYWKRCFFNNILYFYLDGMNGICEERPWIFVPRGETYYIWNLF